MSGHHQRMPWTVAISAVVCAPYTMTTSWQSCNLYAYHSYHTTTVRDLTILEGCRAKFYSGSCHWKRSCSLMLASSSSCGLSRGGRCRSYELAPNVGAWVKLQRQNRRGHSDLRGARPPLPHLLAIRPCLHWSICRNLLLKSTYRAIQISPSFQSQ